MQAVHHPEEHGLFPGPLAVPAKPLHSSTHAKFIYLHTLGLHGRAFYNQPYLALVSVYQCCKVKAEVGRPRPGRCQPSPCRACLKPVPCRTETLSDCPCKLTICPCRLNASVEQGYFLSKNPSPGCICLMSLWSRV